MATKTKRAKLAEPFKIEASTGNVFEDLGLPDAAGRLAKAELARLIRKNEQRPLSYEDYSGVE